MPAGVTVGLQIHESNGNTRRNVSHANWRFSFVYLYCMNVAIWKEHYYDCQFRYSFSGSCSSSRRQAHPDAITAIATMLVHLDGDKVSTDWLAWLSQGLYEYAARFGSVRAWKELGMYFIDNLTVDEFIINMFEYFLVFKHRSFVRKQSLYRYRRHILVVQRYH